MLMHPRNYILCVYCTSSLHSIIGILLRVVTRTDMLYSQLRSLSYISYTEISHSNVTVLLVLPHSLECVHMQYEPVAVHSFESSHFLNAVHCLQPVFADHLL